ncbi:unnamed protein product [Alopecurus aequalis]
MNCSTSGNYTATDAYAANLNQFFDALPENTVSKNNGFFNGTVGLGPDTVYGLAMCPADYSRADCSDCLMAAAASNTDGLRNSCPGSRTVLAMFDRCLVRQSDVNFFGTPEIGAVYVSGGESVSPDSWKAYSDDLRRSLSEATSGAEISPQRFAASVGRPHVFVQCTWDLPADKCKECLDVLSDNVTGIWVLRREGQQKSYSCSLRYSNTTFMVVPFTAVSAPTPQYVDIPPGYESPSTRRERKTTTIAATVGAVFGVISLAILICNVCNSRAQRNKKDDVRRFSYPELAKATSNFAPDEELGAGAFGTVYKGKIKGTDVAVKMIKMPDKHAGQEQVRKDFDNEIRFMSPLHHCNIISLIGCCEDNQNLLLVYELMENGDLESQLYSKAGAMDSDLHGVTVQGNILRLDWPKRKSILIGVASGLVYLHYECKERLMHGDIKPSNVMLGKSFNAKLCDFGLVAQVSDCETSRSTDKIRGTKGYVDPGYADTGRACEKSDVYSFGMLMLEMVCCERPTVTKNNGGKIMNNLVEKVRACYQRNAILDAADRRLRGQVSDEQLKRVLMIGLLCVQPDPDQRPHTRRVLEYLTSQAVQLPSLSTTDFTFPTMSESRSYASTTHNRSVSEDEYSTSSSLPPQHSRRDEEAGTAAFLTSQG